MLAVLSAFLEGIGTYFAARGGQGSLELEQRPVRYWAVRLALFALFCGVLAGIWSLCLSASLKP